MNAAPPARSQWVSWACRCSARREGRSIAWITCGAEGCPDQAMTVVATEVLLGAKAANQLLTRLLRERQAEQQAERQARARRRAARPKPPPRPPDRPCERCGAMMLGAHPLRRRCPPCKKAHAREYSRAWYRRKEAADA